MTMDGRFSWRRLVQRPGGNDYPLAVARRVQHRAVAVATDLPCEAFRLGQIEPLDQILAVRPAELANGHGNVCRAHAARRLATA